MKKAVISLFLSKDFFCFEKKNIMKKVKIDYISLYFSTKKNCIELCTMNNDKFPDKHNLFVDGTGFHFRNAFLTTLDLIIIKGMFISKVVAKTLN